jgi:hypothetical protein
MARICYRMKDMNADQNGDLKSMSRSGSEQAASPRRPYYLPAVARISQFATSCDIA